MKPFTKRLALVIGLLFTALICMGIVYIDNVKHYFYYAGGSVQMFVNTNFIFNVDTNTGRVGFGQTNTTRSFQVIGKQVATNATGNGTSANTTGSILMTGGQGGGTFDPTSANGAAGGLISISAGDGGNAPLATTNTTGGAGGSTTISAGVGGSTVGGVATNSTSGGTGGGLTLSAGAGGGPSTASTNTVGGSGGNVGINSGNGASPSAGFTRQGGNAGLVLITAGNGGSSVRTNGGTGSTISLVAGNGGTATTSGDGGAPGSVNITAGNGATGVTNSNGGRVYVVGGIPGSGALAGDVVVGRTSAGLSRGGLQVGPFVAGTAATLTNLLSVTAVLDFPSIVAGTVADLPVAFAGAADGDVVTLGVPLSSVTNCLWMGFASNAVVYVRAANGQLVTAQDPNSGTFRIALEKYR